MKAKIFVSAVMLALASAGPAVLVSGSAIAAEQPTVSPKFGKPFNEAAALLKGGNAKAALAKLEEAEAASGKSVYETLVVNQLKVAAYAKLGDNANMAKSAEAVINTGKVSGKDLETYKQAAAQGYLASGNLAKATEFGKDDPNFQAVIAQQQLKQGSYAQAEATIRQVIASGNAREEYYLILSEAQRKGGNIAGSADTIQALLKSHPKPEYWKFVLGSMLNEKGVSDKGRLDIYRLIYATNSFTDAQDYTSMAETAIVAKAPGEAKRALEKGFKAGVLGTGGEADRHKRLQATANARAAEDLKVLPGIEAQAATQPSGDALASIADSYLSNGQYDKAVSLYQQALTKGSLTDGVATKLHLGIAYAGAKQNEKARQAFSGVSGKGLNKELAGLWLITLR